MKLTPNVLIGLVTSSALVVAAWSWGASAQPPSSSVKGLESRVAAKGHCDESARYRLVLQDKSPRGRFVTGQMTIRDARPRSHWTISTLARTTFADGSQVTGTTDAIGRADTNGTLVIEALTRAGVRHEFEVIARGPAEVCFVNLRA